MASPLRAKMAKYATNNENIKLTAQAKALCGKVVDIVGKAQRSTPRFPSVFSLRALPHFAFAAFPFTEYNPKGDPVLKAQMAKVITAMVSGTHSLDRTALFLFIFSPPLCAFVSSRRKRRTRR